ncbi:hypothetical protein TNCV_404841 [Trichonephila clavipes]|nr:hypothetical protein TNCV_404841 [Trichonephila clavipes]
MIREGVVSGRLVPSLHAEIVEVEIEVVSPSIVPSGNFAELKSYCHLYGAQGQCPCHDEFRGPRSDYVRQNQVSTVSWCSRPRNRRCRIKSSRFSAFEESQCRGSKSSHLSGVKFGKVATAQVPSSSCSYGRLVVKCCGLVITIEHLVYSPRAGDWIFDRREMQSQGGLLIRCLQFLCLRMEKIANDLDREGRSPKPFGEETNHAIKKIIDSCNHVGYILWDADISIRESSVDRNELRWFD